MNRRNDIMKDAARIAERLRQGRATVHGLMKEYNCCWQVIHNVIALQINRAEWKKIRRKILAAGGMKSRFQKGHKTWNKNLKGIHMSPATEFKKGHMPANHKRVGSIRVRNDKCGKQYYWIKVSEPNKWIPYARYIWQSINGTIPAGFFVIHKSTDTLDDRPANLKLVDRAGHINMMKKRTPGYKKKAARGMKRAWRRRRREKKKIEKRLAKIKKRAEALTAKRSARDKELAGIEQRKMIMFEERKRQLQGPMESWWECTGCGFEAGSSPVIPCPKCGGLKYEKIEQRRTVMSGVI